jgi:replication-associated recombination protein RarA
MKNIDNILLTEKYRPKTLNDLITPKRVGDKLSKGVYQHLLLYGSPGTGKCVTSDALITIKNKISGEIKTITISEYHDLLKL